MDYLAEELKEETADNTKRVKMTEQQKLEYKLYRKACRLNGVEPVRGDFMMGKWPSCVTHDLGLMQNEQEWEQREKAFAAHA